MSKNRYKVKKKSRLLIFLAIVLVLVIAGGYFIPRFFFPIKHYDLIISEAGKYNLDPLLVVAVIKAESSFKPEAISSKQAKGLMQLQDKTAQWCADKMGYAEYSPDRIFDPDVNIKIGVWYLGKYLLEYYDGELDVALAAYNAGTTNVDKWLNDPKYSDGVNLTHIPFKETDNYVAKIKDSYKMYQFLYEGK